MIQPHQKPAYKRKRQTCIKISKHRQTDSEAKSLDFISAWVAHVDRKPVPGTLLHLDSWDRLQQTCVDKAGIETGWMDGNLVVVCSTIWTSDSKSYQIRKNPEQENVYYMVW